MVLDGVKNLIGEQLHAVSREGANYRIAPNEPCPAPAERCHKQTINGNECRDRLGAEHCNPQNSSGANGPERTARARQKNRQMACHGKLQVHQRLDVRVVEVKYALAKIEKTECGCDSDQAEHCGDTQHQAHVPGLGLILVVHIVIGDRQDCSIVQHGDHHDHHRGHRVEIKDQDRQSHEEQHAQCFGDAIDGIAVHALEDATTLLDDYGQAGRQEHDGRRCSSGVGRAGNRDATVRFLQRGGVIHPIAGHTDDVSVLLQDVDNVVFVFGEYLCEPVRFFDGLHRLRRLLILRIAQHGGIQDVRAHPQLAGCFLRYGQLVAGDHFDFDTHLPSACDGCLGLLARRIEHG